MGVRDEFVKALKLAFVTVNTRAFMLALVSKLPFIGAYPWLYRLIEGEVGDLMGKAADESEVLAFFKYIDVRTNWQGIEFSEAAINNWLIQNSPDSTPEQKRKSEDDLFAKFKSFAKFTA